MEVFRFILTAVLLISGVVVCAIGVLGVFRFKYAANRMHAAAINDTLGVALCLLGVAVSAPDIFTAIKLLLVIVFMWMSGPVASHLLCKLEIETNEERRAYMNIHEMTLNDEAAEALAQKQAEEALLQGEETEETLNANDEEEKEEQGE